MARLRWAAVGLVACVPILATWHSAGVPWSLKILSGLVLAIAVARPIWSLTIVAALLPLATYLQLLSSAPFSGEETADLLVAPFLVGACAFFVRTTPPSRGRLSRPVTLLAVVVAASGLLRLVAEQAASMPATDYLVELWHHVLDWYFVDQLSWVSFHVVASWLEGLACAVVAEATIRTSSGRWRTTLGGLLAGSAGAAFFSVRRLVEVSLRSAHPWIAGAHFLVGLRISPFYEDVNATGSFLALVVVPAIWCARARPWRWERATVPFIALALWLSGSRGALVAAVVGLVVAWVLERRVARRPLLAGLATAVAVGAFFVWNPGRAQARAGYATDVRLEMARVGLEMARDAPLFGVGPGQFRHASIGYITPAFIQEFPPAVAGENAHNNFIQVLAEYGLAGCVPFLWLFGVPTWGAWRSSRTGQITVALAGLAGGIVAFGVSCLTGHPLLTGQVFYILLVVVGLTAGLLPAPAAADGSARRSTWLMAALTGAVILTVPIRWWMQTQHPDMPREPIGASAPLSTADGVSFRLVAARSSWFVPAATTRITIPLRLSDQSVPPCLVTIAIDGRSADIVRPSALGWLTLDFTLPPPLPSRRMRRVDLQVGSSSCWLMVGEIVTRR